MESLVLLCGQTSYNKLSVRLVAQTFCVLSRATVRRDILVWMILFFSHGSYSVPAHRIILFRVLVQKARYFVLFFVFVLLNLNLDAFILFLTCDRNSLSLLWNFYQDYMTGDRICWAKVRKRIQNQTVNDGVAHSKNPRKWAYHETFDVDLDLEHILDARWPGVHLVKVW